MAAVQRGWMRKLGLVLEHGAGSLGMKTVSSLSPSLETQLCLAWRGAGQGTEGGQQPETLQSPLLLQTGADRTR